MFLCAFAVLSYNLWDTPIGSGWIDPVQRVGAQDESAYTNGAVHMALNGDWMTPTLAGRWSLEKPPLLIWFSAASMKLLGVSAFTARLPAVLAGSVTAAACFLGARLLASTTAGVAALLLCLSNPLLFTLSRHNMTDILVTMFVCVAVVLQLADPGLSKKRTQMGFVAAITAGILTKSVAGLLPALSALLFAFLSDKRRESLGRTATLVAASLVLASPWFAWQYVVHRQWFLAEMGFQLINVGATTPQGLRQDHLSFYTVRLLSSAPLTLTLLLTALPRLYAELRPRTPAALLLACYLVVIAISILAFRFLSEPYLAPLLPVLILAAAGFSPVIRSRFAFFLVLAIAAIFLIKTANPDQVWGLAYSSEPADPVVAALSNYCEQQRGNDLYILGVEDQFYALVLPLARVRYGFLDPDGTAIMRRPHLPYLGIVQDVDSRLDQSTYIARLRDWKFPDTEPIRTAITAPTPERLATLITAHPEGDFLVFPLLRDGTHDVAVTTATCSLLLSRVRMPQHHARWTCRM